MCFSASELWHLRRTTPYDDCDFRESSVDPPNAAHPWSSWSWQLNIPTWILLYSQCTVYRFGLLKSLKSSVTVLEKTPRGSTRIHVTDGMQAWGLESTWQRTSARWGWWRLMVDSGLEWGCIMMYLVIRWYISNISVGFITSWLVYCILHIIMCTVMTSD